MYVHVGPINVFSVVWITEAHEAVQEINNKMFVCIARTCTM